MRAEWIRLSVGSYGLLDASAFKNWPQQYLAIVDQQMRAKDIDWKWHIKFKDWTGVYMNTKEEAMEYAETTLRLQGVIE